MTSTTRGEILSLIKRHGPMTVQELSQRLAITPMGVRQHLAILEQADAQVQMVQMACGARQGRSQSRVYSITAEGDKGPFRAPYRGRSPPNCSTMSARSMAMRK